MYDDADGDDEIGLITAGVGLADPAVSTNLQPDIILITASTPTNPPHTVSFHSPSRQPRAPPAA
jgi:hypothetical protein